MTRRAFDDETEKIIARMYGEGMTHRELAAHFGGTGTSVRNALKRQNVASRTFADYQPWQGTPEQTTEVVRLHNSGGSVRSISKALGCRTDRVAEALVASGIDLGPRKGKPKFRGEIAAAIVKEYDEGASLKELAENYSNNSYTISNTIRRMGTSVRMTGRKKFWTPEREAWVVEQSKAGRSQESIGREVGRSQTAISIVLRRHGVFAKRATGKNHVRWQGGRVALPGGYIAVRPVGDDFKFCRANSSGYMLEHRLIMGRRLGRMLRLSETVHHINGLRDDNRPENLQLRQGSHGAGVAVQCHDCGSHNVGPIPLAS